METLFTSRLNHSGRIICRTMSAIVLLTGLTGQLSAMPDEWIGEVGQTNLTTWNLFIEPGEGLQDGYELQTAAVALSCRPEVNVSLGQDGYAILTALLLVNAPEYPANMYEVDIMGPLNDTVFCAQLGQELMVVVTEVVTGNSCMSTIFVEDKLDPVLVCTSDILPCNIDIATINFEDYLESAEDNCDDDVEVWYSYVVQNLPCNPNHYTQQILVTWTATDDSGNSTTCLDVIYLQKPGLGQIMFPPDISVSCVPGNVDPSVTGEPTYNGEPLGSTCQYVVWKTDIIIPMCKGSYKILRTWTAMDWCTSGQASDVQEILVVDNNKPNITCPPSITISTNPGVCTTKYTLPLPVVSDACVEPEDITITITLSGIPGNYPPGQMFNLGLGVTLITMKATDPCGNTRICQYSVTVKDNTPPTIICPGNITIGCTGNTSPSNTGFATAFDNCDATPSVTWSDVTTATPNCGLGYNITRTWIATDDSGNTAICMQMIVLTDNVPPLITCPANVTILCTASTMPSNTGGIATATDLCDTSPSVTFSDVTTAGSCPQEKTINRTWKATDDCGNSSTCIQLIFVDDNLPPVITCPPSVTVECTASTNPAQTGSATATDNCDGTPSITYTDVTTPSPPAQFIITRTWRATDDCGNSSTCNQLIYVHDDTPPGISCPANVTVSCTASTLPPATGTATATDNCDTTPSITYTDLTVGGSCPQERTITRSWTAMDDCGNVSTCMQTIVVDDNSAPTITCPGNTTIQCTASTLPGNTGTATATDNCDATPTITYTDVTIGGSCPQERTINRTWRATDDCGNSSTCLQTIIVDDSVAPTITFCPGNITIECTASTQPGNTGGVATATDNCDGVPTVTFSDMTIAGSCAQERTINRTWSATDDCGNASTCIQIIVVNDSNAPVITCPANVTIQCTQGTLPPGTGTATATDNCTGTPLITFSDVTVGGACPLLFTITRTWTASDGCGNNTSCVQTILVTDSAPPSITCPANVTILCTASTMPSNTGGIATATDLCDTSPSVTFSDVTTAGSCPQEKTINRTWKATDDCGNSSTCIQLIFVDDNLPPVIACPPNMTIECTASTNPAQTGSATATDNCDGTPTITFSDVTAGAGCPAGYIITRTWLSTDDCGNSSTCNQIIVVDDNTAPLVSCPANMTIECSASTAPASTGGNATASDNCDASPSVTFSDFTIAGTCPQVYTIIRTWSATDDCSNVGTCNQTIILDDTTSPVCTTMNITVALIGSGMVTILPSQVNAGSSDNCGPVTLLVTPNTFDCDNLGPNTVTLTVSDCSGNSSSCTATVTITDDGGLEAVCQDVTIYVDVNGNASITPGEIDNGSGGGCGSGELDFDLDQTNFNCTDIGQTNIVTLTVTDENDNTSTCTAIVTVLDTIPPVITFCPPNETVDCHVLTDPNNTGQWGFATATDNCSAIVTETHIINLNDCGVGTIVRTFTAADLSLNIATCVQTITVNNPDPLGEDDITWPDSPVNVNICNSTLPENIPDGEPVINQEALLCSNPVINYSDMVVMNVDNNPVTACKIITRTWTITDDCQPNGTFIFVQTIFVEDMVPPNFTNNISNMTKTANAMCVANFTGLIAQATDCAGVTITNNSPVGGGGANANGNYPIGVTTIIFTATDGCGNTSTMDVVITVLDPDPTEFQCDKVIFYLPEEEVITINADTLVTFLEGTCTGEDDFVVSWSSTDPFDSLRTFGCSDVGVHTFPLFFWTADGSMIVDTCTTADVDLRDPTDHCEDGLLLIGIVKSEDGQGVNGVEVSILNAPMVPDTTDLKGRYLLGGLNQGIGYEVAPFNDKNHKEGVSTLDLIIIQKHLLGKAKLSTPYKMIAADANKSGHLTALDLLEIRKVILGIYQKFPNNTSWRFIDYEHVFTDPYNPFAPPFPEVVWVDSVTQGIDTVDFVAVKVGDVNGSYFLSKASEGHIQPRSGTTYDMILSPATDQSASQRVWELIALPGQGTIDGLQFALQVGDLSDQDLKTIHSDLLAADQWRYDPNTGSILVSWSTESEMDLTGKVILAIPDGIIIPGQFSLETSLLEPEAYQSEQSEIHARKVELTISTSEEAVTEEYQLFQNIPNPFKDGTLIRFTIPQEEEVKLVVHDLAGRQVLVREATCQAGMNEIAIRNQDLGIPGIYYYTLYTLNASLTRKMSFTSN